MKKVNLHCFMPDSFSLPATGKGILDSKTFVVKDLISIKNHTSSFGHPQWRKTHSKSKTTAPLVSKLLNSGANLTGITKMDQLAYSLIGNVGEGTAPLNSLYPDRFTGGSSSGSASSVAGKIADFGIGTDTGGSIRVPASSCGLYGLRPTFDRIETTGVIPLSKSFDVIGIFSKKIKLLNDAFEVLKNKSKKQTPINKIILLLSAKELTDSAIFDTVSKTADYFSKKLSIQITSLTDNFLIKDSVRDLFARIQAREIWQQHGEWVEKNYQYLASDVQQRLDKAKLLSKSSAKEISQDKKDWQKYIKRFNNLIKPGTILIVPITNALIPKRNASPEELLQFRSTTFLLSAISSLTGCPELVIPVKNKASGLTFGVGLIGSHYQDEKLLQTALLCCQDLEYLII